MVIKTAILVGWLGLAALGESDHATGQEDDLLAGPSVPGSAHVERAERVRLPVERFLEVVRQTVTSTSQGDEQRRAQRDAINAIERDFRAAQRLFRETHGARLRDLNDAINACADDDPARRALVLERRQVRANAPDVIDALEAIWRELTPAQQTSARHALEAERTAAREATGAMAPGTETPRAESGPVAPAIRPAPWRDPSTPVGRRVQTLLAHRRPVQ